MASFPYLFPRDPERDLLLERDLELSVELVWKAWTEPELLKQWFCPLPWKTVECAMDLRPGGSFRTVMRSPDGQDFANEGCFLELVPQSRMVWTAALLPSFRPMPQVENGAGLPFSAILELFPLGPERCHYRATAVHPDRESAQQHKAMGFHEGWGAALDQLVSLMASQRTA